MPINLMLAAVLAVAGVEQQETPALGAPIAAPAPILSPVTSVDPSKLVLPKGTMVRLMVIKEVNSRDNHPGDRFVLRVDEDVQIEGVTLIPTGAKAWGELVGTEKTSGVGKSGRINARLLYVEAGSRKIDLEGQRQSSGSGGTGQVVASVLAFGPFGLLMKGNNASLKAGEILNGYTVADASFERPAAAKP